MVYPASVWGTIAGTVSGVILGWLGLKRPDDISVKELAGKSPEQVIEKVETKKAEQGQY